MSDLESVETPEQREWEHTEPPLLMVVPDPGEVVWAYVADAGEVVGAVWIASNKASRPRAGIILASWVEPSVAFQTDLSPVALAVDADVDGTEWIDHLTSSRSGNDGRVEVGDRQPAALLSDVRAALGEPF